MLELAAPSTLAARYVGDSYSRGFQAKPVVTCPFAIQGKRERKRQSPPPDCCQPAYTIGHPELVHLQFAFHQTCLHICLPDLHIDTLMSIVLKLSSILEEPYPLLPPSIHRLGILSHLSVCLGPESPHSSQASKPLRTLCYLLYPLRSNFEAKGPLRIVHTHTCAAEHLDNND